MVSRIDRDVGSILAILKELGLDEDTIVFFSSDNGASGAGGRHLTFFESVGPLRGKKRQLYEGGIRVPMLARWPGVIEARTVSDEVWAFWDFLPTAAELAQAELPADIDFDGVSVMPVLLGKESPAREFLYWEFFRWSPMTFSQAVRLGDWKGVRNAPDAVVELYDLQADIGEEHDIAEKHPEIVARIADIMETSHVQFDEYPI
jgi:arylsulfatase A-like enzyme